ncbi:MAG: FAD-dependent monooxygenase, partial [Brasilonema sp.]
MMTDVLIVGAGPTGLTVANLLARYKLNFKIIDKKAGPINQSRANIVHVRTLELLDKLSLAEKAIKQGVKITDVKVFERGKHITTLPIGSPEEKDWTPFPYALALEQSKTERLLLEEMEKYGVRVEWCTEFLNLTQTDDEVSVMVKRPDGNEEKITARWLVGADGASSPVRHALKVGFSGSTYEVDSFQADIELEASHSSNAVHLHLCHGILVGMTPLYGECHFRIFGSISSEFAAKFNANETQSVSLEDLQAWLDKYFFINTKLTHIYWTALYHTHRRIADHFRIGRCFLVGDAAHVHSPAGGQGMNLGIGDGYNLAWKLALVINKHAHPNLLDSYEAERIPVANMILNGSDVGFELETSNKPVMQWFRFYVLPLFINLLLRLS